MRVRWRSLFHGTGAGTETMTTLPQPKLAQLGMMWIVTSGSLKNNDAFAFLDSAIEHARRLDAIGTPVALGHTVFGWVDLFNPADQSAECNALVTEWRDGFMADPWHKARFALAVTRGEVGE